MPKTIIQPYDAAQKLFLLRGEPLDLLSYPYLRAIYNTNAPEVALWTARQVSKSTTLANMMVLKAVTVPNSSQIYIAPLQDQAEVFASQRLKDFLIDSPIIKNGFFSGSNVIDQVFRKRLQNNSWLACGYAQRTADRLRGRSAGDLRFDESCCKSTTYVETTAGTKLICEVQKGDVVYSVDQGTNNVTLDRVVQLLDHGTKEVWQVTYDDGTILNATAGTRFRSPAGWTYLHELVDAFALAAASISGQPVGGCLSVVERDRSESTPPVPALEQAGRVCLAQVDVLPGRGLATAEDLSEPGLGRVELSVRYPDDDVFRFCSSPLFSRRSREALSAKARDAGVVGPADLGGDSLLVHGRRKSLSEVFRSYCDARFFQSRERPSGLVVVLERDRDGGATHESRHKALLLPSDEPRAFPAIHLKGEAVHHTVDDVQGGHSSRAPGHVFYLRLDLPADYARSLRLSGMLPERGMSSEAGGTVEASRHRAHDGGAAGTESDSQSALLSAHAAGESCCTASTTAEGAGGSTSGPSALARISGHQAGMAPSKRTGPLVSGETEGGAAALLRVQESGPDSASEDISVTSEAHDSTARARNPCPGDGSAARVANSKSGEAGSTAGTPGGYAQYGAGEGQPREAFDGGRDRVRTSVADVTAQLGTCPRSGLEGVCAGATPVHTPTGPRDAEGSNGSGDEGQSSGTQTARIVSIKFLGLREVCDLETEKYHNFFANGILVHNCQDIFPDVIPVIKELAFRQANSTFWYCGTPKSMANHIEKIRGRSTAGEWAVKCTTCNAWNHEWTEKNIGKTGVVCDKCGGRLDTNTGHWVARRKMDTHLGQDSRVQVEGYRIPQLIVKPIMDDPRKWLELHTKLRTYDTAQFRNEVLGLPAESGVAPITIDQLRKCCLTNRSNELPLIRDPSRPPLIMGVDWAFNGEKSYTFVTIGAWNPFPNRFEVYFWKIFKGVESDSVFQMEWIKDTVKRCDIQLVCADWGAGHVQNLQLANALGSDRLMQVWHTGMKGTGASRAARVKWEPKTQKFHLARTRVLTDTFETLRLEQIRFPRAEECGELFDHILAEQIEYSPLTNLQCYTNIEPDDGLHSLTYALLGSEMFLNGSFRGHAGSTSSAAAMIDDMAIYDRDPSIDGYYN